jgi:hypothetical protein
MRYLVINTKKYFKALQAGMEYNKFLHQTHRAVLPPDLSGTKPDGIGSAALAGK